MLMSTVKLRFSSDFHTYKHSCVHIHGAVGRRKMIIPAKLQEILKGVILSFLSENWAKMVLVASPGERVGTALPITHRHLSAVFL